MNRCEHPAGSEETQTVSSDADIGTASLYEAGIAHMMAGRFLDAQVCCQQALAADSNHADALHLMGLLSFQAQQFDHAILWFERAIRRNPKTDYLSNLASALKQAGRPDEALQVLDKMIQLKPDDPLLWCRLAAILVALGRNAEALLSYQHALKLDPHHWEAAYHCGEVLQGSERFEEALSYFNRCDELRPDHVRTLQARARCLRGLKRFEECFAVYMRAYALDPADSYTCNNIGDALLGLGRYEEGLSWFDKALALRSDLADVHLNKGYALLQLHRFDEAIEAYERLTAVDPGNARGKWQWAHVQLLKGNFEAGWAAREARWQLADFSPDYPKFPQAKWLGQEAVMGKTILVCADEGLGDTIQFARFLPDLASRGARIILVVQDALVPLLSGVTGVAECIAFSQRPFPPFDMHCPLMSLPLACGARPDAIPSADYLPPLPVERIEAWKRRLGPHDRLRVGLVWSGNPKQGDDRNRSMPLATLAPLLGLNATFVSLQKDPRPADSARLRGEPGVLDLTAELTDFVDTAALLSCLDLVITVCTSVAHLAGTLGQPTWLKLPFVGDWRWQVDRDDSPWYPTVRLFRQDASRDYAAVVERVRAELAAVIATFTPGEGSLARGRDADSSTASLYEAGIAHMMAGRFLDAQVCGQQALAADSNHADALQPAVGI
jgi:tetratricopeptide (TPR) repeat protein